MLDQVKDAQHSAKAVAIRAVTTSADFDALEAVWRRLHDASSTLSVFQSFEWQRSWWQHFGEPNPKLRLHILVLEQDGLTLAIAPFYRQTLKPLGLLKLRQLNLIGRGISDYADLLITPGFEDVVCAAIFQWLVTGDVCDKLMLMDVPDASPLHTRLEGQLRRAGWGGQSRVLEQCPTTQLMSSWPQTLETFEDSHRKRLLALDRKLRKNFKVEVRRIGAGENPATALDEFMAMHQRRWTQAGEPGAFAGEKVRRFHHDVAQKLHARGWLVLTFLMLDGCAVVANYSFKSGGRLQFYLSGTGGDESARKFAPGILLHSYGMQAMIEEGVHTYDFLRGTERYKYDLGAKNVPIWRLAFVRNSLAARIKNRIQLVHDALGAHLKHKLAKLRSGKSRS